MAFLPVIIAGWLASRYFFKDAGWLERMGSAVFFTLAVVPFLVLNLALASNSYITEGLITRTAIFTILLFGLLSFLKSRKKIQAKGIPPAHNLKEEITVLIILMLVSLFSLLYYSNSEFILSLGSYLLKGDASCFAMQTLRTSPLLNPEFLASGLRYKFYDIICIPGNTLFTASLLPVFKLESFRAAYLLFNGMLFLFTYLLTRRLVGKQSIALIVAAFAVFNPYILSVEVLDRNIMSLALSAFMFYLLIEHKNKPLLQGLVFGLLSGTGLRFLPLLFCLPIFMLYHRQGKRPRDYLIFILGFAVTFAFNIPHLFYHGFSSLKEDASSLSLFIEAYTSWKRTPFLPLPNLLFYLVNILNFWGCLVCGIILFGAANLLKKDRTLFIISLCMFLPILLVLSWQRSWVEGDKYRIIIEAFLPLFIFLAYGIKNIFVKRYSLKKSSVLFICLLLPFIFLGLLNIADFQADDAFYLRRRLYQRESREYHLLAKNLILRPGILPNYERLSSKLDLKRKRIDEKLTFRSLFLRQELPGALKFRLFYSGWREYFANPRCLYAALPEKRNAPAGDYVYLEIDFAQLVKEARSGVKVLKDADIAALDLENEDGLFDVYYSPLSVPWQENILPVCILLNKDNLQYLKELSIELNAFVSAGKDDNGFDIVNSVNYQLNPGLFETALRTGLRAFPLYAEENKMIFRVPRDMKIIIKNWLINGENGAPYKLDSWRIEIKANGKCQAAFFYNEPESYL